MANAQTLTHNQLQFERVKNAYDEKSGCGFSFGNGCATGSTGTSLFGGKSQTQREVIPVSMIDPSE